MEKLMQYIWQHRLFDHTKLVTTDGRKLRIIDNGQLNTDSGPDFFNAKISIDGCVWAGNVEMHRRASDWRRHNHHLDPAYDSVVLHVVEVADTPVYRTNGEEIPTLVLSCSPSFRSDYETLVSHSSSQSCAPILRSWGRLSCPTGFLLSLSSGYNRSRSGCTIGWICIKEIGRRSVMLSSPAVWDSVSTAMLSSGWHVVFRCDLCKNMPILCRKSRLSCSGRRGCWPRASVPETTIMRD